MTNKKTFAWIRAALALVLALVFLAVTGFAFVDMLAGPASIADGAVIEDGAYLKADVTFIMDIVGVEKNAAGNEIAYYAVSPVGSSFMMIRYPLGDLPGVRGLEEETRQFLEGESLTMDFRMIVTGVAEPADDASNGLLAEWFAKNVDWMVAAGVIPQEDDYSAYLSPYVLKAGTVGAMAYVPALVLTILAALLVVYAIVEAALVLTGIYNKKPVKKQKKEKPAKTAPIPAAAEKAPAAEEPVEEIETEVAPAEAESVSEEESVAEELSEEPAGESAEGDGAEESKDG